MRTTLTIDDDLLQAAKSLAEARSVSVGKVISDLARKGLRSPRGHKKNGFPVFDVRKNAPPLTLAKVKENEDEA